MIGRTLSHYKVLEKIGEGGMGEVYLAKDTKLDREVAVKVLPTAFSENKERLARFEREAKLLASLNHPNIAAIHEIEESDGVHFLALEYVPGETLAERIKRGPIPIDEALPLFKQIAEGLEAAHEKGVIHRDLKPANIKVTPEGKVKVLDFGLAKAMAGETPSQGLSESPTITRDATEAGVLLGTAPYMSPEQARGKPVDKRTDIWAFGCCLYEALTGKAAYLGDTVTDTIAKIVEREPDWDALPAATPAIVQSVLRRCLHKDLNRRVHDVADARIEIEEGAIEPTLVGHIPETTRSQRHRAFLWICAALTAIAIGIAVWYLKPPAPRPITKTLVGVEPAEWLGAAPPGKMRDFGLSRTSLTLSPDGRHLVYGGGDRVGSRLYLHPMDQFVSTPIPGTEDGSVPFFSPDGEWIGFWADGKLQKVRIDGGPAAPLCDTPRAPHGANWGSDDTIVFGQYAGEILRVSADGGVPEPVTTLMEGEVSHRLPQLMPDGAALLFMSRKSTAGSWNEAEIEVQSLETGERKVLVTNGADARYVATGHLVFVRTGSLMAAPFDPKRLEITGGAVGVLDGVMQAVNAFHGRNDTGAGQFTFSASGSLVYVPGGIFRDVEKSLVWVDRQGAREPVPAPYAPYAGLSLSPDGNRVAVNTYGLDIDIWVYDIPRGTSTRLTLEDSSDLFPIWTPDGSRITFSSDRSGDYTIYSIPADGSGPAEQLTTMKGYPRSWSPDGQVLAFRLRNAADIWMLPVEGEPQPFIQSAFREEGYTFSPDGRWLAYTSDQSGREEVYITPYPGPGPKIKISTNGGLTPAWASNGQELFYIRSGDSEGLISMMAVDIQTEPNFAAGIPRELFQGDYDLASRNVRRYDVTPDGRRFLAVRTEHRDRDTVTELRVVLNWFDELKRLVPTN